MTDVKLFKGSYFIVEPIRVLPNESKRMRAKLRELKQQLRMHMHDPVPQTGGWLKLVVQGYFTYYAVPGNLESLAVFRDRLLGCGGELFVAEASNATYRGPGCLRWVDDSYLHRACSIPILQFASPPVI